MDKRNKRIWMWLLCITIIGCAAGYICLAFNRVETDIIDGEYIVNSEGNEEDLEAGKTSREELADSPQRGKHLRGNWGQIMSFIEEQLPELDDIGYYIETKTEGKASLIVDIGARPIELYDNSNNLLGCYYSVYVGEQWEDHRANWDWFYVNDEIDGILWCEIVNIEYYTLEEWRSTSQYKEKMDRIREFRNVNSERYAAASDGPSWRVDEVEDGYEISLYDKENNIYFSQTMPVMPAVRELSGDILEAGISVGSLAVYVFYADTERAIVSQTYFNPILIEDRYVAYMEAGGPLTITDIFCEGEFYQEIIRNFSKTADPISAVIRIEIPDNENIRLEYYEGDDYNQVVELIPIEI